MDYKLLIILFLIGTIPLFTGVMATDLTVQKDTAADDLLNYTVYTNSYGVDQFWVDENGFVYANGTLVTGSGGGSGVIPDGVRFFVYNNGTDWVAFDNDVDTITYTDPSDAVSVIESAISDMSSFEKIIISGDFTITSNPININKHIDLAVYGQITVSGQNTGIVIGDTTRVSVSHLYFSSITGTDKTKGTAIDIHDMAQATISGNRILTIQYPIFFNNTLGAAAAQSDNQFYFGVIQVCDEAIRFQGGGSTPAAEGNYFNTNIFGCNEGVLIDSNSNAGFLEFEGVIDNISVGGSHDYRNLRADRGSLLISQFIRNDASTYTNNDVVLNVRGSTGYNIYAPKILVNDQIDLNANEIILDADGDLSLSAVTDDRAELTIPDDTANSGLLVKNTDGSIRMVNLDATADTFSPGIDAFSKGNVIGLDLRGRIPVADDTGTQPVIRILGFQNDATPIETRPLLKIENVGTDILVVYANGTLGGSLGCANGEQLQYNSVNNIWDCVTSGGSTDISSQVSMSSAQSINSGVSTAINFTAENYDTDSMHSTVTNNDEVIINTDGKYLIIFEGNWASLASTNRMIFDIKIDTTSTRQFDRQAMAESDTTMSVIRDLTTGQIIQAFVYQDSGSAKTFNGWLTLQKLN